MNVSVIIPCYNAEPYIAQTIGSVLEQSRIPEEIIVVDDGSTDRSAAIAREFGGRVRVVSQRFGRASRTRNYGASLAAGDALMFLDADDVLGPTVLETLVAALSQQPESIAICPWYRLELAGGVWVRRPASCVPLRPGGDPLAGWLTGWYHPPCSVLWSHAAYEVTGGWDERATVNDDGDIMMRALVSGVPLVRTLGGEAYYRRLPDGEVSLSGKRFTDEGLSNRIYVADKIAQRLEQRGILHRYRVAIAKKFDEIASDAGEGFPELRERCEARARRYAGPRWVRAVRRRANAKMERLRRRKRAAPSFQYGRDLELGEEVDFGLSTAVARRATPASETEGAEEPRPRVSVVIPTYNRDHVIGRALESVLAQTFDDFEVLIVDDGSVDTTSEVIAQYDDPRVRYLVQPQNRGVSAARNRGLHEARGEFVAFLDSDDEWMPTKLEAQVACFEHAHDDVGLVYCGVETVDADGGRWEFQPQHSGDVYRDLLAANVIHTGSGVMIRRSVVGAAGFFDEAIPAIEDYEYWIRIARHFAFAYVDAPLLRYYDTVGERKSLNTRENLDAREWLYRVHGAEMRRAGTAHLFLLESARRQRAAGFTVSALRSGSQSIFLSPRSYPAYPFFFETLLPPTFYRMLRRLRQT